MGGYGPHEQRGVGRGDLGHRHRGEFFEGHGRVGIEAATGDLPVHVAGVETPRRIGEDRPVTAVDLQGAEIGNAHQASNPALARPGARRVVWPSKNFKLSVDRVVGCFVLAPIWRWWAQYLTMKSPVGAPQKPKPSERGSPIGHLQQARFRLSKGTGTASDTASTIGTGGFGAFGIAFGL